MRNSQFVAKSLNICRQSLQNVRVICHIDWLAKTNSLMSFMSKKIMIVLLTLQFTCLPFFSLFLFGLTTSVG
jgi:hypothetical protein